MRRVETFKSGSWPYTFTGLILTWQGIWAIIALTGRSDGLTQLERR